VLAVDSAVEAVLSAAAAVDTAELIELE